MLTTFLKCYVFLHEKNVFTHYRSTLEKFWQKKLLLVNKSIKVNYKNSLVFYKSQWFSIAVPQNISVPRIVQKLRNNNGNFCVCRTDYRKTVVIVIAIGFIRKLISFDYCLNLISGIQTFMTRLVQDIFRALFIATGNQYLE